MASAKIKVSQNQNKIEIIMYSELAEWCSAELNCFVSQQVRISLPQTKTIVISPHSTCIGTQRRRFTPHKTLTRKTLLKIYRKQCRKSRCNSDGRRVTEVDHTIRDMVDTVYEAELGQVDPSKLNHYCYECPS